MKKIIPLVLSMTCLCALTGCGNTEPTTTPTSTSESTSSVDTSSATTDSSSDVTSSDSSSSEAPVAFTEAMLASLKGTIDFYGSYSIDFVDYDEEPDVYEIETTFSEDYYFSIDQYYWIYLNEYYEVFKNDSGLPVTYEINFQNVVTEVQYEFLDYNGDSLGYAVWDDFANPFETMTVSDFEMTDTYGKYTIKEALIDAAGVPLATQEDVTMKYIEVYVEEDVVTKIVMETDLVEGDGVDSDSYYSIYTFDEITRGEDVEVGEPVEAYPSLPEQADLKTALQELASATSYTSVMSFTGSDYAAIGNITAQVIPNSVYYSFTDPTLDMGYYQTTDTAVTVYSIDDGVVVAGDTYDDVTLADDALPSFDFSECFFIQEGEAFTVANDDLAPALASYIMFDSQLFTYGAEDYATALIITLEGTSIKSLTYAYEYYAEPEEEGGEYVLVEGTVTMTISNINSTTIDADFSTFTGGQ